MESPEKPRLSHRFLRAFSAFVCRRAVLIVLAALVLAAGSVTLALTRLTFITDRNDLVNPEAEFNRRFLRFKRAFGDQELMLLFIAPAPGPVNNPGYNPSVPDAATREAMKDCAREISRRLRQRPDYFPALMERADPATFGGTRMLYLPQDDLERLSARVRAAAPLLAAVAADPGVPGLLLGLRDNIERGPAAAPDPAQLAEAGEGLRSLLAGLRAALADAAGEDALEKALFDGQGDNPELDPDGYFFSWGGRLLFVPMLPAKDPSALDQVKEPIAFARKVAAEVAGNYPGLAVGISGRPAIYSDEMDTTGRDMARATVLSLIGVGLLFIIMFRSVVRPLLAVFSLALAIIWTVGATTLLIGHLNIFAMVFGVVLVGLGIDFGIHLLNHYRHGLGRGLTVREALADTYGEIGMGTVIGALTTAAALSTASLTEFRGLAELGLICGIGIVLCLIAMLVVFPALLVLYDRKRLDQCDANLRQTMREHEVREIEQARAQQAPPASRSARAAAWIAAALMLAGIAVAGAGLARGWTPFDYNLLELNDPTSAAVQWEKLLIAHDQRASYAVSVHSSPDELRAVMGKLEKLKDAGLVRDFESMFPADEAEKRRALAALHDVLPPVFAGAPAAPGDAAAVRRAARRLQASLRALQARGEDFARAFGPAATEVAAIVALCDAADAAMNVRLREFEPRFFGRLRGVLGRLRADARPPEITVDTLPAALKARYAGKNEDGSPAYALYVYPAKNVWVHELAGEFNSALMAVNPEITGVTVQIFESSNLIVKGFLFSALYALGAIVLLVALDLRRPLALLLALTPLVGGLAILAGVMVVSGLKFNFANFFAVPILVGTTVDAGVYLVHCQRHGNPARQLRQTRRACALCGMTTFLGFGTMMFAAHRGVVSLGVILAVGTLCALLVSYFLVPVVLGWFNRRGARL